METKTCKCCGKTLPIEEFSKNKCSLDGYFYVCKTCRSTNISNGSKQAKRQLTLKSLDQFTSRDLMLELKRRGYDGILTCRKEINLKTLN